MTETRAESYEVLTEEAASHLVCWDCPFAQLSSWFNHEVSSFKSLPFAMIALEGHPATEVAKSNLESRGDVISVCIAVVCLARM